MGVKTAQVFKSDGATHHGWLVHCPACGCPHLFDERWGFNGDHEAPTFTGSMLVHGVHTPAAETANGLLRSSTTAVAASRS